MAAGLGVTEYARNGRAALEIEALWAWIRAQFDDTRNPPTINPGDRRPLKPRRGDNRLRSTADAAF